jgi:hypothetical protein
LKEREMPPTVRLFGTDNEEIHSLDAWVEHAPPEKGLAQWKDGYSAKEQAKAWLRPGQPSIPPELWSAIADLAGDSDQLYGRPEHQTRLDRFPRARQHDLFGCLRRHGATTRVIGVEAKACEGFDGIVADRAAAASPSKKRARCNLLARALFGRTVLDEETGAVLDPELASHGYQLWTAAVGTIIEAQRRNVKDAIVVVHQFHPRDLIAAERAGDHRAWASALRSNATAFDAFAQALLDAGSRSYETVFVKSGTKLRAIKVETIFA